jgi:hypothetical protein
MIRFLLTLSLIAAAASANLLIPPTQAMRHAFGAQCSVTKKNLLLTGDQADAAVKMAQVKLGTKIYRTYTAKRKGKVVGYGVLITRKVRQKNAAVLYMIAPGGVINSIEIIAFNEPPEYLPQSAYLKQFEGKKQSSGMRVGKEVPTISGATLSARNITDGARLALAVFHVAIRKRP